MELGPEERLVGRTAFRAILAGSPGGPQEIALVAGLDRSLVENTLRKLKSRGLAVDDQETGSVVGIWGLTLLPTPHRLEMGGRKFYAWCAIDAVGIPAALGETARIDSKCHECGAPLHLEVVAGRARTGQDEAEVWVWAAAPDLSKSLTAYT